MVSCFQQSNAEAANAKLANLKEKSQNDQLELQQKIDSEVSGLRKQLEAKDTELTSVRGEVDSLKSATHEVKTEVENIKVSFWLGVLFDMFSN